MRAILKACQCAVVPFAPAVNVLPVGTVPDRRIYHAVFVRIFDKGLPVPGGLCYLIHSE